MKRHAAIVTLLLAACGEEASPPLTFTPVHDAVTYEADVLISERDPVAARARVLEATLEHQPTPTFLGAGPWETIAVHPEGRSARDAVAAGRTFIRQGGGLRLDARLGAGDRGAFMGGVAFTGAEQALFEVRVADPNTLGARFVLRVHAVESGGHRDATPLYLQRPVPRGTYRAWLDIPAGGGRYLLEVRTVDRDGGIRGRAWSSPVAVERPWL